MSRTRETSRVIFVVICGDYENAWPVQAFSEKRRAEGRADLMRAVLPEHPSPEGIVPTWVSVERINLIEPAPAVRRLV